MAPLGNEDGVVRFYFQYGHIYVIRLSVKVQVCFYIHRVALLWTREQVRRQSWPKSRAGLGIFGSFMGVEGWGGGLYQ